MNKSQSGMRISKRLIDRSLLKYLVKELNDRSESDFENYVRYLLTKKVGPSLWAPRDGRDGGIDFASNETLFQMYGQKTFYGSVRLLREKINDVNKMRRTAKENGLTATNIIYLTRIHRDEGIEKQISNAKKQGIEIYDIYQTAKYLYDVFYPFDLLEQYYESKCESLMKEEWPYDIDENTFVENFDFGFGNILERNLSSDKEDCMTFINKNIFKGAVFCIGYYGMGKSTISKMLFQKWNSFKKSVYPIFIGLTHKLLSDFHGDKLGEQVADEIMRVIKERYSNEPEGSIEIIDLNIFKNNVIRMIENKKILLFFDGIDESICDRDGLFDFMNNIFINNYLIFLTCRLEYRPFFDIYQALRINKSSHLFIELNEWSITQWERYISGLRINYPQKKSLISKFSNRLYSGTYSTLPGRPLFLKMLSDLEINNETGISILPELYANLAEIYFKFIKWKIRDDYNRKGGAFRLDLKIFEKECFQLLREIALMEYKIDIKVSGNQITLSSISELCHKKGFVQLKEEYISNILLKSSLFAILRRTDEDKYVFSHKSFMEYLVAYSLVHCLFPSNKDPSLAICDETWQCFQFHEVSQHFLNEIERVQTTLKLNKKGKDEFILNAFKNVIDEGMTKDLRNYDERFQEVLYYIGKLEIKSPNLIAILKEIVNNKEKYNLVYYRTASIALAWLAGKNYCDEYVLLLIEDSKDERKNFEKNQEISIRYYGEATLKQILKKDIDDFISQNKPSNIMSLKIFTYFTTIEPKPEEIQNLRNYLTQINEFAIEQNNENLQKICHGISNML